MEIEFQWSKMLVFIWTWRHFAHLVTLGATGWVVIETLGICQEVQLEIEGFLVKIVYKVIELWCEVSIRMRTPVTRPLCLTDLSLTSTELGVL